VSRGARGRRGKKDPPRRTEGRWKQGPQGCRERTIPGPKRNSRGLGSSFISVGSDAALVRLFRSRHGRVSSSPPSRRVCGWWCETLIGSPVSDRPQPRQTCRLCPVRMGCLLSGPRMPSWLPGNRLLAARRFRLGCVLPHRRIESLFMGDTALWLAGRLSPRAGSKSLGSRGRLRGAGGAVSHR